MYLKKDKTNFYKVESFCIFLIKKQKEGRSSFSYEKHIFLSNTNCKGRSKVKKILVFLLAFVIGYSTAWYLSNWYEQANGCIFTVGQTKYKEGVMLGSMNIGDLLFDVLFNQKYNVRNMNVSPFIKDGEIYIPIRYVLESYHIEYQYDKDEAALTYKKVVKIDAKTNTVYVKGQAIKTNNPIIVCDNEIFVSAKDLHEIFLANIKMIQNKNSYSLFVN